MTIFVCSNPNCRATYQSDPHGPCPRCKALDGGGWSCMERIAARRANIDCLTPAETAIRNALIAVEAVGADVRLTDSVCLLSAAQHRLADFVDGVTGIRTLAEQKPELQ